MQRTEERYAGRLEYTIRIPILPEPPGSLAFRVQSVVRHRTAQSLFTVSVAPTGYVIPLYLQRTKSRQHGVSLDRHCHIRQTCCSILEPLQ